MITNMTGSSILNCIGHTIWEKLVNLSVRLIFGDGEPHSDDFSDSESDGTLDSDDDWQPCVRSVDEDECFYDTVSFDDSQDMSYFSFPIRSLSSVSEKNLSGPVMGCRHPSKSDQVPDFNEKGNLTQKSQVPYLNKRHLVEGN